MFVVPEIVGEFDAAARGRFRSIYRKLLKEGRAGELFSPALLKRTGESLPGAPPSPGGRWRPKKAEPPSGPSRPAGAPPPPPLPMEAWGRHVMGGIPQFTVPTPPPYDSSIAPAEAPPPPPPLELPPMSAGAAPSEGMKTDAESLVVGPAGSESLAAASVPIPGYYSVSDIHSKDKAQLSFEPLTRTTGTYVRSTWYAAPSEC